MPSIVGRWSGTGQVTEIGNAGGTVSQTLTPGPGGGSASHSGTVAARGFDRTGSVWSSVGRLAGDGVTDDTAAFQALLNTAAAAGGVWRAYRNGGQGRHRLLPDFLIGTHAWMRADRFLTRDRGFYRTYFKRLKIVDPSSD